MHLATIVKSNSKMPKMECFKHFLGYNPSSAFNTLLSALWVEAMRSRIALYKKKRKTMRGKQKL